MVMLKAKVIKVKRPKAGPTVPPAVRARVSLRKGTPRAANLERVRVTEDELLASICRDDFYQFVKEFTEVVIAEEMVWNWHIPYLCKQLQVMAERVFKGEAKLYDLVINIPPGTTKSTICSVMFPAWIWTRMKEARFIGASYAHHLAMDLARKCRDVVTSEKYQRLFPEVELRTDQNTKGYFANTSGGYRYSVGTNGSVLGMHAHFIVVDDPIDPESVESELDLKAANRWMKTTLSTRKVNKEVSVTVLVMQRLHQDDPTANFLKQSPVRWIKLPAEVADGPVPEALKTRYRDGLLDPVRLSWKVIAEEQAKGPQYYCTPGHSPILMSNWMEKEIKDVQVGEYVMGWEFPVEEKTPRGRSHRQRLAPSRVIGKGTQIAEVFKVTTESGRVAYCTKDHKWFFGSYAKGAKKPYTIQRLYAPIKIGAAAKGSLLPVYNVPARPSPRDQRLLDWLGGMLDGEGACKYGNITIHQSETANPKICAEIDRVLRLLKIDHRKESGLPGYSRTDPGRMTGKGAQWVLRGGRSLKVRLLNHAKMVKKFQVRNTMSKNYLVEGKRDKVVSMESVGEMPVYWLETETGNYVVWGFASSNSSQFRQNPVPPGGAMFNTSLIKVGTPPAKWARLVRFWDKAASSGKGDYTVGLLLGLDQESRLWVLDVVRGRWDTHARDQKILGTADTDGTKVLVGVEQEPGSGGKESAEATVRRLIGFRVKVVKVDSTTGGKERRADPVSYQVNGGNLHLPKDAPWADEFRSELEFFPFSRHDDQVDALSGAYNLLGKVRRAAGALGAGQSPVELAKPKSLTDLVTGLLKDRGTVAKAKTRRILLGGNKEGQGA